MLISGISINTLNREQITNLLYGKNYRGLHFCIWWSLYGTHGEGS